MVQTWDYTIKHNDVETSTETDITSFIIGLPLYTSVGNSEINNGRIVLDSPNKEFILTAPILHKYDNIRIQGTTFDGTSYDHVYDIMKIIPSEGDTDGTRVELVLLGQEHHINKINYSKTHYFEGTAEVIQDIGDNYNSNKQSKQPTLSGHNVVDSENEAPTSSFQTSIYSYGINEEDGLSRVLETTDKLGSSVDAGGALDFFDVKFDTDNTDYDNITINVFPSGSKGSNIILEDTESVNTGEAEGGIEAEEATIITSWGAVDQGTLPIQHSQYKSREQRFPLQPSWVTTETYQSGSNVQDEGVNYISIQNNNQGQKPSSTIGTFWNVVTQNDYFGNFVQYSPWTVDKARLWRNSGSNSEGALLNVIPYGPSCFDSNLVIFDEEDGYNSVQVDTKDTDPANIDSDYLYSGTDVYRGIVLLVNGTAQGILATDQFGTGAGNDRNDISYTNSISIYTGAEWRVLYSAHDGLQCNIIDEGRPYEFTSSTWSIVADGFNVNHVFHPHDGIINVDSPIQTSGTALNAESAIRVRYDYNLIQIAQADSEAFYKVGAWLNFRFPFPITTKGEIGENVGQLYGGAKKIGDVPNLDKEPATLDIQNMNATHDGFRGFIHGESSEDYGPISSLDFLMKIDYQAIPLFGISYFTTTEANFNMRCIIKDTNDNAVFQNFVLNINGKWEPIHLPISAFEVYRARKPLGGFLQAFTPLKKIEALQIFEWRNAKSIVIQTQDSYDDNGRYSPFSPSNPNSGKYSNVTIAGFETSNVRRIDLYLDAFRFTKPLLVNTGIPADRAIEKSALEKPDINDYYQLQSDAFAELRKSTFPRVEFVITTQGRYDIEFGDSFYYRSKTLIPEEFWSTDSPDANNNNTIKLVARKIEYSISDAEDNEGGFLRTITGVRRFT